MPNGPAAECLNWRAEGKLNNMNTDNRNLLMTAADNAEINSVIVPFHKLSERRRAKDKSDSSELAGAENPRERGSRWSRSAKRRKEK